MIDTSIPLQVRPLQIDSPIENYGKALAIQHMANQNQASQNALSMQNAVARELQASGGDLEKALPNIMALPGGAEVAMKLRKDQREGMKTDADIDKTKAETIHKLRDATGAVLGGLLADPDIQNGTPAAMDKTFSAIRSFKQYGAPDDWIGAALNSMPRDPSQIKGWLATKAAQHAQGSEQALKLTQPNVDYLNTGGAQVAVNKNPLAAGGVGRMASVAPLANSLTPEQALPKIEMAGDSGLQYIDKQGGGASPVLPAGQGGVTNYGNLRPQGASTGFQQFGSKDEGWSALDKNLQSYASKGINTVEGIINRWAPPTENNTSAYVANVAKRLGVDPKQPLDMSDPFVRSSIAVEIARNEHPRDKLFGKGAIQLAQAGGSPQLGIGATGNKPQFKDGYWVTPPSSDNPEGTVQATPFAAPPKGSPENIKQSSGKALQLIDAADELLNKATGSWTGTGADMIAGAFGKSTEGAKATAQLKAIEGALMMAQPRMEGPQSDKDVALYRQMAGQVGDPTVPVETRRAALQAIRSLHEKYAGGTQAQAAPKAFSDMPDPSGYVGKIIQDDKSGVRYKSDGKKWVTVK